MKETVIRINNLKIASWNVHGLGDKINDVDFVNNISNFHICFLLETWCTDTFNLDDKYVYCKNASKKKNRRGRYSGGIAVIIDKRIRIGTKIVRETEYGIWIKLCKHVFGMEKDLYICGVYIPPTSSPYAIQHPFESVENDMVNLSNDCDFLLMGDMNARSGNKLDYVPNDNKNNVDDQTTNSLSINVPHLSERFNEDFQLNPLGKSMLNFCSNCQLYIVNGRTLGDTPG
jgi:exonuclease III